MAFLKVAVHLLSILSLISLQQTVLAEEQQILDAGLDNTLNHIKYEGALPPVLTEQHILRKLRTLDDVKQTNDQDDLHTGKSARYWLLWALYGFTRHGERYQGDVRKWEARYKTIPEEHQKKIASAVDYASIYDRVHDLYAQNGRVCNEMVKHALTYYQIPPEELMNFITIQEHNENWDNQDRVNEALQHIVRDWTAEGLHEREPAYRSVLRMLDSHFADRADRKEGPIKIAVPGSGLGRLAHEIAALGHFEVTANEWSAYMRIAYRYIESLSIANTVKFHPFVDWWSYQPNREEMTREVTFPDAVVNASSVVLAEGDFNLEFANETNHYDAIVTFFFMDTATNMMEYFDTIDRILKKGGLWINLGPFLYHDASVEFTLEEMLKVAEGYGFEFIDADEEWGELTLEGMKARGRDIGYMYHLKSLRRNNYFAQLSAAIKKT